VIINNLENLIIIDSDIKIMEVLMWIIRWILIILVFLIFLGFALQNQEQMVSVRILQWMSPNMPLYWPLYIAFVGGVLLCILVVVMKVLKFKGDIHQLQRENRKIREELNRLRNANIEEGMEQEKKNEDLNKTQIE
jgi:uncharacterized integral membrane protein